MKFIFLFLLASVFSGVHYTSAQTITYSEVEKADNRNLNFEILGNYSGNFLVFKSQNRRRELTIYDNLMSIKQNIKLDFISDKAFNIDFVTSPENFLMVWQYEKGNTTYCKGAKMNGVGQLVGNVIDMDFTKTSFLSPKTFYNLAWSENKKKILMYKTHQRNDMLELGIKVYDENFTLLDSSAKSIDFNERRESFSELQIDNEGTVVFTKSSENARPEYIHGLDLFVKKLKNDTINVIEIPLEKKQLIDEPFIKIDNANRRFIVNSFSYKRNAGNVDGIFTAIIEHEPYELTKKVINIFDDSLRNKLSGRPDWRTAFDNFNLRNIIMKKDGGFIAVSEEYYRQRRFSNTYDDRYSPGNSSFTSDYYLYNRGSYGYYRPFNDGYGRDIVYNYNDIISFSFSKDIRLQWNSVINKTTSDTENDNFLSFANMNEGGEIHFLFLQKDNNRQIISDHALQPNGSLIRYATLKGKEAGYYFMPRLGRQTGLHQMIIPCLVRSNIAFAKIDF